MPRPPSLPNLDWQSMFASDAPYEQWLNDAEFVENAQRMEAIRKELQLTDNDRKRLAAVDRPVHVLAIAEDWCGDVVRHVPVLQKLADHCSRVMVKYVSRDQASDVFIRFLTNGGEAIPKFVFVSAQYVECGNWGPMPENCKELIARGKASGDVPTAREKVAARYKADPEYRDVVEELLALIERASCEGP